MRAPFRNRQFRRLFAGRVVTNVGDSVYFIAAMWLVYSLTGDPFYTGLAGFLTRMPAAFQFLVGPLVDRWSIRWTLAGTQAIQALVVLVVPAAYYVDALTVSLVLVVMPTLAALNQLVYPAQTAALPRLLDDEELVAANSAFSLAYQSLDMIANGLSGVLIGLIGAVALFLLDAVTFAVAALLFATVAVPLAGDSVDDDPDSGPGWDGTGGDGTSDFESGGTAAPDGGEPDGATEEGGDEKPDGYLARLLVGVRFLRGTFLVPLIAGAAIVNFTGGMVLAALPAYAGALAVPSALAAIGDAGAYGILMAAFAAGNFLGAVGANAIDDRPLGTTMVVGFLATGVLWTAAILFQWLPITAALGVIALLPLGAVNVQLAAVVQSAPPEEYVGRASSVFGSAASASLPIGSLVGGVVAGTFGPLVALLGPGVAGFAYAVYVLAHPDLRELPAIDDVQLE